RRAPTARRPDAAPARMKLSLADLAGRVKLSLADLAGRVKGNLPGLAGRMPQSLSRLAGRVQLGLPVAAGRIRMPGLAGRLAIVGASAAVLEHDGVSVLAVRRMNERLAERLGERAGLEVRIVDYASFVPGQGPLAVLNSDALSRGEPVAAYIGALRSYAASLPVAASTGETVALLQALLPADKVMVPVGRSTRGMLLVALVIA